MFATILDGFLDIFLAEKIASRDGCILLTLAFIFVFFSSAAF